jgi:hypothetical protein
MCWTYYKIIETNNVYVEFMYEISAYILHITQERSNKVCRTIINIPFKIK